MPDFQFAGMFSIVHALGKLKYRRLSCVLNKFIFVQDRRKDSYITSIINTNVSDVLSVVHLNTLHTPSIPCPPCPFSHFLPLSLSLTLSHHHPHKLYTHVHSTHIHVSLHACVQPHSYFEDTHSFGKKALALQEHGKDEALFLAVPGSQKA